MGGCCFKKIATVVLCLLGANFPLQARCPLADKYRQEGMIEKEVMALRICAVQYNDDESQMQMAENYMKGEKGLKKDEKKALYQIMNNHLLQLYFHLGKQSFVLIFLKLPHL